MHDGYRCAQPILHLLSFSVINPLRAVDINRFAGQKRNVFAEDRRDELGHVAGGAGPARRNALLQEVGERPFGHRLAVEVGHDVAWCYVEHGDALVGPFHREAARDGADCGFRRAVGDVALDADFVEKRADVDDRAATAFHQMPIRLAARNEYSSRIGSHHLVVGRDRQFMAAPVEMDARIVDQPVERAGLACDARKRVLDARLIGHVARNVDEAACEFHRLPHFGTFAVAREAADGKAAARQLERDRSPDATARARDRDYLFSCAHEKSQKTLATEDTEVKPKSLVTTIDKYNTGFVMAFGFLIYICSCEVAFDSLCVLCALCGKVLDSFVPELWLALGDERFHAFSGILGAKREGRQVG